MIESRSPHISICVPTYKRPAMLVKCLDALKMQQAEGFTYSIVVVDNDPGHSASELVLERSDCVSGSVTYVREEEPNISRARNKAVATATGEYVAFVDDDEVAEPTWLLNLYDTCRKWSADGVLGPVIPLYEGRPPEWLVRSGLCDRSRFTTGTRLDSPRYLRTGNILLRRSLFEGLKTPFDPDFGRTGGEDVDFLNRMVRAGRLLVWCDEARVHETVPVARQQLGYHLRRAVIRGVAEAEQQAFLSYGTIKSVAAVLLYAIALPFLLVTRYHLFVRYLVKWCDHLAKVLAHFGVRLSHERTF